MRKLLLTFATVLLGLSAVAQDFSAPQYAKWGDTPEERKDNILNNTFLKESIDNRDYKSATDYLKKLIDKCPAATENIYARGVILYKNKINIAKTLEEKKGYVDTLLMLYDLRLQYFANHSKRGKDYILERKAREFQTYREEDRAGVRKAFEDAIDAQIERTGKADAEVAAIYFKNICDDFKNDVVTMEDVMTAYEKLTPYMENLADDQKTYKEQFDACFATSGAASCENLEALFTKKLAAAPDDVDVLGQATSLMSAAKCNSAFYFKTVEKYYAVSPSSKIAMFLAQAFQDKQDYAKANTYLREALKSETDPAEQEKLYIRIGVIEMASKQYGAAVEAVRQARNINPDNGYAYYLLAQLYVAGASNCATGLAHDSVYWVAYDLLAQAVPLLSSEPDTQKTAQGLMSTYRAHFPSAEECFFNELKEGSTYTVSCGIASGISTRVRYSAQ